MRSTSWVAFRNIAFISASGSGRPCPCEPQIQLWTPITEGHTSTVTLLKVPVRNKQLHLYYWFLVTTVLLDDFNGTFSAMFAWFPEQFEENLLGPQPCANDSSMSCLNCHTEAFKCCSDLRVVWGWEAGVVAEDGGLSYFGLRCQNKVLVRDSRLGRTRLN